MQVTAQSTEAVQNTWCKRPLIISGPVPKGDDQHFHTHKPRILQLVQEQERIVRNCLNEAKKRIAQL